MIPKVFLIAACLFFLNANQEQRGWQGLITLHSTRAEVERQLGFSRDPCNCIYETQNEFIDIDYATDRCKGSLQGWNVPVDTVLTIKLRPKADKKFSELNLDLNKYVKSYDDTMAAYYANNEEGITYAVTESGLVHSITYGPSVRDNALRCAGWPLLSKSQAFMNPRLFDDYSDIPWPDETGRLDNFAITLQHDPNLIGYIIVYAGRRACINEGKDRALRAKKYLVESRAIPESRVKWIDGGYREELTVVLQPVPSGAPELTASPTVKPSDVQLIKNCKPKTSRRKRSGS